MQPTIFSLSSSLVENGKGEEILVSSLKGGFAALCEMLMVTAPITHTNVPPIFTLLYMQLKVTFSNLHKTRKPCCFNNIWKAIFSLLIFCQSSYLYTETRLFFLDLFFFNPSVRLKYWKNNISLPTSPSDHKDKARSKIRHSCSHFWGS